MKRAVVLATILSLVSLYAPPVFADQDTPAETPTTPDTKAEEPQSYMLCHARGATDAKAIGTDGSFFGGFCGGALLGLVGTGIAVLAQSEPEPPALALLQLESDECRYAYSEAYRSAARRKKQNSALGGGLLGTLAIVTILLASSN